MEGQRLTRTVEGKLDLKSQPPVHPASFHPTLHPLHQPQQALGNRAFGRFIQAKLKVSEPGDIYEQEADRVADAVVAGQSVPIGNVSQAVQPKLYRVEMRPEDLVDSLPPEGKESGLAAPEASHTQGVQRSANGEAGAVTPHFEQSLQQAANGGGAALLSVYAVLDGKPLWPRFFFCSDPQRRATKYASASDYH